MRSILSCLLAFWAGLAGKAPATPVEPLLTKSTNTVDHLGTRLNAFDTRLEAMREKLRIPGLALVVVKDGGIVYLKGKGYRNLEERLPATEDTLFAIGSTTKAFTALLVLMAVEEGKLALEDSPKKCLPYFSLKDPEADRTITLRHLLTHTSGLDRTDLGWVTGKLSSEELIRLAGRAEPIAKVGKEFHYQNTMYLAAGECVAAGDIPDIPIDALERRVAQAHGTDKLARLKTLVLKGTMDFVHQDLTGTYASYWQAPERYAELTVFQAFDRDIGRARVVFDGERAADYVDFAPIEDLNRGLRAPGRSPRIAAGRASPADR